MPEHDFLTQARAPAVRECYAYWQSKKKSGRLPGRQHIDPAEMKSFLEHVILFDVERPASGGYRFRQRLVGTHIVELFGRDTTGFYVDESSSTSHYESVHARLSAIVDTKEPAFGIYYPPTPHLDFLEYEHLTLPLASDGRTVDMLFGVRCGLGKGK
jgi:hypothetical protein